MEWPYWPLLNVCVAAMVTSWATSLALRVVAWSLVRQQQGYMLLAQIEGELNAADHRAVEGLVGEFGDDGSGVGSSSSLFFLWMTIRMLPKPDSYFCT